MALFEEALDAFRTGRDAFDLHMMISESPVVRASRQQLIRQISARMIDEAANGGRIEDALAEVESLGPHGVADALAEQGSSRRWLHRSPLQPGGQSTRLYVYASPHLG